MFKTRVPRGVALVYEGKGKRIGEWTSPGDKMFRDEILAAVATDTGVALCGYAKDPTTRPASRRSSCAGTTRGW
jgi:hypothetical protein